MSGTSSAKLELTGVSKSFMRDRKRHPVLDRLSLRVGEGEFVTLIGPSGSGKSTLFRLIGGVELPDEGSIRIDGKETTGERGHISYMPQQASLFPWLSVAANIGSALTTAGIRADEAKRLASEWLGKIGLGDVAREYPHVLSGGMQQRVSFLRALLMPRAVMCLDEPFAALDALTRAEMQAWLLRLWEEERRSVLFVTHSIEEALTLSDRIYVLSRAPARILKEIRVPFSRPRREDVWKEPEFVGLKQEVLELLGEGAGASRG
ncbi:ABC transporter ATP-binding protein [Cohnella thailandensis]|uniref:ABC transporter ATP-binding protein n=1 Tax=Cohnella thailandensis TaxID=557557 RepID=A0A841SXF1_9BACL|nr:ABC transporter ATP-binding protein [Cohnella thailandensis]MBB6636584.1 ABC transporter ATP-binding protein [Cohnella thailandensis]MBP1973543.1 ABC-type nitrate/sulfonate/bicarbonate transport system ATPase subunit [Cohnella thailandensis]